MDKNEQEKYMEMIEMPKKFKGFLEKLKEEKYNEGFVKGTDKGINIGIIKIIHGWIEHGGTLEEFSKRTGTPLDKIYEILNQNPPQPSK